MIGETLSVGFPFESNHIEYYNERSKFDVINVIILWLMMSLISGVCWDIFAPSLITLEQMAIVASIALVVSAFLVSRSSKESRRIAREALEGNLIEPEHPRHHWGRIFTHVHPSDAEIGRPILRFDPSDEITAVDEDGSSFFMTDVECISSTSQKKWDSYTEWYDDRGWDSDSEGFGGHASREVSYSYTEYTPVFQVGEFEFESTTRTEYVVGDAYHLLLDLYGTGEKITYHIRQRLDAKKP